MKVGDLVRVKPKYSDWDIGAGILLTKTQALCKVLFTDSVLIFHQHELEALVVSR